MNQGDIITSKRQIMAVSPSSFGPHTTATVHILQHQPTSRPIEDRYSIDVRTHDEAGQELENTTLLLGVYDGHRGSSAADYVAQALPSEILSTAAQSNSSMDDQTQIIQEKFNAFDRRMLSSFKAAPSNLTARTPRRILSSIATKLLKSKQQKSGGREAHITEESTTAALRVLSGCTASMLLIKAPHNSQETPSAQIINLGDSRVVVASFNPEPIIHAASIDTNSGVNGEQSLIISQHPSDDPKDIFVGGRLFGETLSTRAFGDGIYKLPLRTSESMVTKDAEGELSAYLELTSDQQSQHKDLISQLSDHQQAAASSDGKRKIIPLIDRYDTLFWAYKSPPYVSAIPQIFEVQLPVSMDDQGNTSNPQEPLPIVAVLATDGLWDMVSSKEAVDIIFQALMESSSAMATEELNLAQILLDGVVERTRRKPGDDVTILVLVFRCSSNNGSNSEDIRSHETPSA